LINLLFVYDEYSDVSNPDVVDKLEDIVIEALESPDSPSASGHQHVLGDMTRECVVAHKGFQPYGHQN